MRSPPRFRPARFTSLLLATTLSGATQLACSPAPEYVERPTTLVDPFIGSGGFAFRYGSAFPGAVAPNGMAKVGPDTSGPWGTVNFLHYSGYWYGDDTIQGFSHLHLHGTGATDLGVLGVMPTTAFDATRTTPSGYQSPFDKKTETASPGYYAVTLSRGDIRAELTATTRAAHHRYTWPNDATTGYVIVDLAKVLQGGKVEDARLEIDAGERVLRGSFQSIGQMSRGFGGSRIHFEARVNRAWRSARVWSGESAPVDWGTLGGEPLTGDRIGAALEFDVSDGPVELRVGLSLVSEENAGKNLRHELGERTFDETRAATEAEWNELLSSVRLAGGDERDQRIFYSALYRSFVMPTIYSDVDGSYVGHDGKVHEAKGFRYVSDLSLWDTYRTLHPLYALVAPREARDSVVSLHRMSQQGGAFPRWPLATGETGVMIGSSAEIVLADAYLKGITDFDVRDAYERMRAAAMDETPPSGGRGGRDAVQEYLSLGYVPHPRGRSVSVTTEYSHADFALAQLAKALGEDDDATHLMERRLGYRELFDEETGFLWAHDASGALRPGSRDPLIWEDDYAEANAWQSVWMAQHDVDGLVALFGGKDAFFAKLTAFFEKMVEHRDSLDPNDLLEISKPPPYYWQGNEPDIHAPYLFAQAGRPADTQKWVAWIRANEYGDGGDGLPGNDDGGTMSAWYVFAALGFYPVPGSDEYIVGTPLFPRAELRVPGGTFTIEAENAGADRPYVQSVSLNGKPLAKPSFRHADVKAGGTLRFVMGEKPSDWGT